MKINLMINSEISKQFLAEEDALKGFKKAVANNQTNLALRVLSDIITSIMQTIEVKPSIDTPAPFIGNKEANTERVLEIKAEAEKKTVSKKAEAKE